MKKLVALGLAAAGLLWVLGKDRDEQPVDTWAAGTDRL